MVAIHPERGMPATPPSVRPRRLPTAGLAVRAVGIGAIPLAIATGLLALEDAFELGNGFIVGGLVVMSVAVLVLLLVGLHELMAAEARTGAALARATTAEAAQRSRADELARVLKASETLALSGEGRADEACRRRGVVGRQRSNRDRRHAFRPSAGVVDVRREVAHTRSGEVGIDRDVMPRGECLAKAEKVGVKERLAARKMDHPGFPG